MFSRYFYKISLLFAVAPTFRKTRAYTADSRHDGHQSAQGHRETGARSGEEPGGLVHTVRICKQGGCRLRLRHDTVDGSEIRRSPGDVVAYPISLLGFIHPRCCKDLVTEVSVSMRRHPFWIHVWSNGIFTYIWLHRIHGIGIFAYMNGWFFMVFRIWWR